MGADKLLFLDQYQAHVVTRSGPTAHGEKNHLLTICGLGIAGEAGEVADLIKKHLGHGHALDREKVLSELGDVLWYVAVLAHGMGATLSDVAEANAAKLRKRYPPDGYFNLAQSIARVDMEPTK